MTGFRKNKEKNREIIEGELLQSKTQEGLVEDEVAQSASYEPSNEEMVLPSEVMPKENMESLIVNKIIPQKEYVTLASETDDVIEEHIDISGIVTSKQNEVDRQFEALSKENSQFNLIENEIFEEEIEIIEEVEEISVQVQGVEQQNREQLQAIQLQLTNLQNKFDTKIMMESKNDAILDNLHSALQSFKTNEIQIQKMKFVKGIIRKIEDIKTKCIAFEHKGITEETRPLYNELKNVIQDLEDLLYYEEIEAYLDIKVIFEPNRHKLIRTVLTDNPSLDRQIVHTFKSGYMMGNKVVYEQPVEVYKYQPNETSSEGKE